jgi:hypothetical protein
MVRNITDTLHSVAGLWLGLNCFCFILTIVEIILLARHSLKPKTFVIMNTLKSAIWVTIFVFDIIAVVRKSNDISTARSAVSLVLEAGLT